LCQGNTARLDPFVLKVLNWWSCP